MLEDALRVTGRSTLPAPPEERGRGMMALQKMRTMSRSLVVERKGLAELLVLLALAGLPWLIVTLARS